MRLLVHLYLCIYGLFVYITGKQFPDLKPFFPNGSYTGFPTGGLWDPNSWGQFLGGTSRKRGRDRGFTDGTHIAGLGMRLSQCRPHMGCVNVTEYGYLANHAPASHAGLGNVRCYTGPVAHCGGEEPVFPLWNLHVHSKNTAAFRSELCSCHSATMANIAR